MAVLEAGDVLGQSNEPGIGILEEQAGGMYRIAEFEGLDFHVLGVVLTEEAKKEQSQECECDVADEDHVGFGFDETAGLEIDDFWIINDLVGHLSYFV